MPFVIDFPTRISKRSVVMKTIDLEISQSSVATKVEGSLPLVVDWADLTDIQRTADEDCQDCD